MSWSLVRRAVLVACCLSFAGAAAQDVASSRDTTILSGISPR